MAGAIGWHSRNLHYAKNPPDLGEYLKPPLSPAEKRNEGARKVRALFESKLTKKGDS